MNEEKINKDEVKERIFKYLNEINEKPLDERPSIIEIPEKLHIGYRQCIEIIEELYREGKIEIVEAE